jgi:Domain of unknown function (DUF4124)
MTDRPSSRSALVVWCLSAGLVASAVAFAAPDKTGRLYRWTDDKGVVHFGDAVPPQFADQDQTILNRQGVAVGAVTGRRSAEQLAADEERRKADALSSHEQKQRQLRDENLLATYLSVTEIESLRDRRTEILDGQARAIAQYLEQLQARATQLEDQMRHFRPYSSNAAAPALPQRMVDEAVRTLTDVRSQQRALIAKREEVTRTRGQFDEDIARFRELKGLSGKSPTATPR